MVYGLNSRKLLTAMRVFAEYFEFMDKYNESPDDISLLVEYTE